MKIYFALAIVLLSLLVAFIGIWFWWDYLPGTLYRDRMGFQHGTGVTRYYYDTGELMSEEWIRAGVPVQSRWYRPDGSIVATSIYDRKTGGIGYYLRQDGSIRMKVHYAFDPKERMYFADGEAIRYDEQGAPIETIQYRHGQPEK
jgi:antitoxin component YwqK of YwqJK toxin-antitoxin module